MKHLSKFFLLLSLGVFAAACGGDDAPDDPTPVTPVTPTPGGGDNPGTTDDDDETAIGTPSDLKRVSVHDPSVVYDPESKYYYIFGS